MRNNSSLTIFLFVLVSGCSSLFKQAGHSKCVPLLWSSTESDTPVCVCNSTYCDSISLPRRLPRSQYLSFTTSKAGLRFEKYTASFTNTSSSVVNVTINGKKRYQTIFGWGGAFTDAAGININSLSVGAKEKLLRSYFSKEGIAYNYGRVPIGATDFSTYPYSYDERAEDDELKHFELAKEDFVYKIPLIKRAQKISENSLQLFASPWIAPRWIQTEKANDTSIQKSKYQVWANYLIKFLQFYKLENIDFWGITTANEPITMALAGWPFVKWSAENMHTWLSENFGPTLRKSEFRKIKILTHDDQRPFLEKYVSEVFSTPKAKNYVDGIAVHWYYDRYSSQMLLNKTHYKYPNKFILGTEAAVMQVKIGFWNSGESYVRDIIQDLNNWVTGWVDWNLALDLQGGPNFIKNYCSSAIVVNAKKDEFYKQPMYYAMGHFSKFIPPGSVRVEQEHSNPNMKSVAFIRPDGGTVVVILNEIDEAILLVLQDARRGIIEKILPANSFTTLLYW